MKYHDGHLFGQAVLGNSVDSDQEQSDQGLHCLPFRLQFLDIFFYGKTLLFKF